MSSLTVFRDGGIAPVQGAISASNGIVMDNYGYLNVSAALQAGSIHLLTKQMVGSTPRISGLQACGGSVGRKAFSLGIADVGSVAFQNL